MVTNILYILDECQGKTGDREQGLGVSKEKAVKQRTKMNKIFKINEIFEDIEGEGNKDNSECGVRNYE